MSEDPKDRGQGGFRKPKGIPPRARQVPIGSPPARPTPFPQSQPDPDALPEDLTVPDPAPRQRVPWKKKGKRTPLQVRVPTSPDPQRATQFLSARTSVDKGAPTVVDTSPVDQSQTQEDQKALSELRLQRMRDQMKARLQARVEKLSTTGPTPADDPRQRAEQLRASYRNVRVVEVTAELKAPAPAGSPRDEDLSGQVSTSDVLAAMDNLGEADELDLSNGAQDETPGEPEADGELQAVPEPAPTVEEPAVQAPAPTVEEPAVQAPAPTVEEPAVQAPAPSPDPPLAVEEAEEEDEPPTLPEDEAEEPSIEPIPESQTAVWLPGQMTPVGVTYEEMGSEELSNTENDEPAQVFESPWDPRDPQELMAQDDRSDVSARGDEELDDQRATDPRVLGAPRRVEIRQVESVNPDKRLVLLTAPNTTAAEQYRVLSLKLKENVHVRSIGIMSPAPDVEAEVVAANLALALAEGNRSRICLVDGDMRHSSLAKLLGVDEGPSLADQVRLHRRDPDAPWIALGMGPSFHLIPGTERDPNPAELLNSEAVLDLMDELRRAFDYIVISTPPLLDSADGVILQEHSDGVILAARAGLTRQDAIKASLKHLTAGKVLGTVLVDVPKMPKL